MLLVKQKMKHAKEMEMPKGWKGSPYEALIVGALKTNAGCDLGPTWFDGLFQRGHLIKLEGPVSEVNVVYAHLKNP